MKIWIARHGQTAHNKAKRMQGLTDEPLNELGLLQAKEARRKIGAQEFDAVYASPLDRAIVTGSIIGSVPRSEVIVDERLIEVNFGIYELRKYYLLGPQMTLYWNFPTIIPRPSSVESIKSMVARSSSFLRELEQKDYENVLVACHGGIMRALCGYLEDAPNGLRWHKAHNCEIRVYESIDGRHRFIQSY